MAAALVLGSLAGIDVSPLLQMERVLVAASSSVCPPPQSRCLPSIFTEKTICWRTSNSKILPGAINMDVGCVAAVGKIQTSFQMCKGHAFFCRRTFGFWRCLRVSLDVMLSPLGYGL